MVMRMVCMMCLLRLAYHDHALTHRGFRAAEFGRQRDMAGADQVAAAALDAIEEPVLAQGGLGVGRGEPVQLLRQQPGIQVEAVYRLSSDRFFRIEARAEEFAVLESRDTGKPRALAREVELCYACCAVSANWAAGRSEGPR